VTHANRRCEETSGLTQRRRGAKLACKNPLVCFATSATLHRGVRSFQLSSDFFATSAAGKPETVQGKTLGPEGPTVDPCVRWTYSAGCWGQRIRRHSKRGGGTPWARNTRIQWCRRASWHWLTSRTESSPRLSPSRARPWSSIARSSPITGSDSARRVVWRTT
jgi:hypothetical protein